MTDSELVAGCLRGSMSHQKALYERYAPLMMGLCMRYAASEAEAEDILQDGFVTVFRKLDTFAGTGELGGWLRRVFLNTALMHYRRARHLLHQVDVDELAHALPSDERLFDKISLQDLMEMIQKLPLGARMVFNLFAIEGYEHKEIADELGISVGTSKSQYSRARELLRAMIAQEEKKLIGHGVWKK